LDQGKRGEQIIKPKLERIEVEPTQKAQMKNFFQILQE